MQEKYEFTGCAIPICLLQNRCLGRGRSANE